MYMHAKHEQNMYMHAKHEQNMYMSSCTFYCLLAKETVSKGLLILTIQGDDCQSLSSLFSQLSSKTTQYTRDLSCI